MGKAKTQRSLRTDETAHSINGPDVISNRTASAFASLIAAASVAQVRLSSGSTAFPAGQADAGSARFARTVRPSVSLRVFSAAMAEAVARPNPMRRTAERARMAQASDELLLQKLEALERRIKGLEAQVGTEHRTNRGGGGPILCAGPHSGRTG